MPQFTIKPRNASLAAADIITDDARDVISLIKKTDFRDVDVLNDGRYAFSVRCQGTGVWLISQRQRA